MTKPTTKPTSFETLLQWLADHGAVEHWFTRMSVSDRLWGYSINNRGFIVLSRDRPPDKIVWEVYLPAAKDAGAAVLPATLAALAEACDVAWTPESSKRKVRPC